MLYNVIQFIKILLNTSLVNIIWSALRPWDGTPLAQLLVNSQVSVIKAALELWSYNLLITLYITYFCIHNKKVS